MKDATNKSVAMNKPNKARKHAELIKAWADGATIQYMSIVSGKWTNAENNEPAWYDDVEYRVKPTPEPDVSKFVALYKSDQFHDTSGVYNSLYKSDQFHDTSGVYDLKSYVPKNHAEDDDFVITNKLELIFDGETKELKNVIIHGKD